jgi:asparagine synthase (glutamine-hydrolysing)
VDRRAFIGTVAGGLLAAPFTPERKRSEPLGNSAEEAGEPMDPKVAGGIVGWAGPSALETESRADIDRMLDRLEVGGMAGGPQARMRRLGPSGALGGSKLYEGGEHGSKPALCCVIDGRPIWRDAALALRAHHSGHASALAEGYRRCGTKVLDLAGGFFRLALVDLRAGNAFLAVDRLASLPLYYTEPTTGVIVFSSSLDALRRHPLGGSSAMSASALLSYFHFQVVYAPDTIYHNVHRLLPGQWVSLDQGRLASGTYWRVPWEEPRRTTRAAERDLRVRLRTVLSTAVADAVQDEEPHHVGACLSGGLDTSTVLGLATEHLGQPIQSFTVRFDVPGYDEAAYAAIAARHFDSPNHVYTVGPDDTLEALPHIVRMFDEPFGNASAVGTFFCAKVAAENGVTTLLTGDGGDELFAASDLNVLMLKFELFSQLPSGIGHAIAGCLDVLPATPFSLIRRARSYVQRALQPMPARMRTYEYLSPDTCPKIFEPEFLDCADSAVPVRVMEHIYARTDTHNVLQRQLNFALHAIVADNDLRKVERMCALAGVAPRFPLLDERVVSFVAEVPPTLLVHHFRARHFYRQSLRDFLPAPIIAKQKHCFTHPLGAWLSAPTALRSLAADALRDFARRGIVRPCYVTALLEKRTLIEQPEHAAIAWYMLVLEHWLRERGESAWS